MWASGKHELTSLAYSSGGQGSLNFSVPDLQGPAVTCLKWYEIWNWEGLCKHNCHYDAKMQTGFFNIEIELQLNDAFQTTEE